MHHAYPINHVKPDLYLKVKSRILCMMNFIIKNSSCVSPDEKQHIAF